ncbi:uncharacterized protein (DUF1501 family) [Silvibacterium bohemicum]|uniref:Uncharacterized protein (DUF1501 family) n=1 Tax=Silvibacterium bohemicum TaxID=1577686 RepID=A0A841K3W5_9BACT|nr:DUF1501 domain-containing protein [Silvibacterium bohemicum]MBB6145328.1 uncharacterized protein (DUF1501 family) [Silvibacterium bohemicum]
MMNKHELSRRQFLRTASMASMAGLSVSPFLIELNSVAAMAQQSSPTDYRALVCIFLQGGNDGHGTVIATDPDSFSAFTTARSGAPGLAYSQSDLLPIVLKTPQTGRTFALNPYLTGVQNLFNAGRAAVIANTGTLIEPVSKTQVVAGSAPLPASLYSHFDQTAAWQAISATGGSAVHTGWGGAMADLIASSNASPAFTCISTAGVALFLSGITSYQLNVTPAGPVPIAGLAQPLFGQQAGSNALASILSADETNLFAKEYGVMINRSIAAQASLSSSMLPAGAGGVPNPPQYLDPITNVLTNNGLAASLQTVARVIGGRSGLGVSRQIFYVELDGFDMHENQAPQHARLLTQLGQALEYFDGLMIAAGLGNQVTTFTTSDFGRTLTANSNGTDHGWGSHHFVVGGAVNGQDMYGQYPVIGSNQANDTGAGRLIPTTGVEQYAGTLARWFGLSDGQVKEVFPNFINFGSNAYMGFMS